MISQEEIKKMIDDGLIFLDKKGEMQVTEKGLKQGEELLKKDGGAREYMKKVAKYFDQNPPDSPSSSVEKTIKDMDFIDSTELDIYERYGVNKDDELKNYQLFCKLVEINPKIDNDTMFNLMKEAKYFEIPDSINLLLQNTSNEIRRVRLPHYFLFLDFSIIIYDKIFHSALITDVLQINEKLKKPLESSNRIDIMTFFSSEEGVGWAKFDLLKQSNDKYIKKLQEYLMNFVDFINNEDIKLMFKEKTKNNEQRRIKKGKIPLPSFNKIYVVGYLKRDLDKLQSDELKTRFTHRFWVRGHFRRFIDKTKYNKLYEQYKKGELKVFEGKKYNLDEGFLRVWIYPHIKGEGILINKNYKLK